ncbi:hypothetical protein ABK040_011705 [Willaertia magna]
MSNIPLAKEKEVNLNFEQEKVGKEEKKFYIPSNWDKNMDFKELLEHKYAVLNTTDALIFVEETLKKLGYNSKDNNMLLDYIKNMIADILLKNGEVFITENDIKQSKTISELLNNTTPDFIIKSKDNRRTLIIVCTDEKEISELKSKYEKLEYFADFKIITYYNFQSELKNIFSDSDIGYLYENYQVFLTKYFYWKACVKFKKILVKDKENLKLICREELGEEKYEINKATFKHNLETYSNKIKSRVGI